MYSWQMVDGQGMNYDSVYRFVYIILPAYGYGALSALVMPLLSGREKRITTSYI